MEKVTDKLQRRQDERLAKLEEMKTQRESATGKQESANYFRSNFTKEKASVEDRLATVTSSTVEKSALPDYFDELSVSVQRLQKFITESTLILTSFEIRKSQDEVDGLLAAIEEKRNEIIPKKKFAFKGRQKKTENPKPSQAKTAVEEVDGPIEVPIDLFQFQCGFVDKSDASLVLQSQELRAKDVGLTNLRSCEVKLFGSPNAIHMNNLTGCKVFSGPVPAPYLLIIVKIAHWSCPVSSCEFTTRPTPNFICTSRVGPLSRTHRELHLGRITGVILGKRQTLRQVSWTEIVIAGMMWMISTG